VSCLWWDNFLLFIPLGIDATYLASLWVLYHRSCKYFPTSYCYTYRFLYAVVLASIFSKSIIDSFWFATLLWLLIIWCEYNLLSSQHSHTGPQVMLHQPGLINDQDISSWPPLSMLFFDPCILFCYYIYCVYCHSFCGLLYREQNYVPGRILHKCWSDGYFLCVVL